MYTADYLLSKLCSISLGWDSQRFLNKNSYLSTTIVVIFMLYLSKNSYLRIFVNPGPGSHTAFSVEKDFVLATILDNHIGNTYTEKANVICISSPYGSHSDISSFFALML